MTENVIGRGKLSDTFEVSDSYATTFLVITGTVCSLFIKCSDTSPTYCIVCGSNTRTQRLISSFRQTARRVMNSQATSGLSCFVNPAGQRSAHFHPQDANDAAGHSSRRCRRDFCAAIAEPFRRILIAYFRRRSMMAS